MSPDCPVKQPILQRLMAAAIGAPKHGQPHTGDAWAAAFDQHQTDTMQPLRDELRAAITNHENGTCCPTPD